MAVPINPVQVPSVSAYALGSAGNVGCGPANVMEDHDDSSRP
jgi:hypothetical protein